MNNSSDVVSRKAVREVICGLCDEGLCNYNCIKIKEINKLPEAPKQTWILVSERYPEEEGEDYLICYDDGTIRIRRLYFDLEGKPYFEYGLGVVAWMPLPTSPYNASPTGSEGSDKE